MEFVFKNFGIMICSIICYSKIENTRYNLKKWIIIYSFTIILALMSVAIDYKMNCFTIIFLFLLEYFFMLFFTYNYRCHLFTSFSIAFSLSYIFFVISVIITSVGTLFISYEFGRDFGNYICVIVHYIIVIFFFKIKRIKKGMPFLHKYIYSTQGIIIAMGIIFLSPLIDNGLYNYYYLIAYALMLIFSILIFIYWRTSITRHYLERLSIRNIDSLNAELVEKNEYIERILEDKGRLEKLNHKNYKLVPAMQGAVMHYLDGVKELVEANKNNPAIAEFAASREIGIEEYVEEGNRLIAELNKMQEEWTDIVNSENLDGFKDIPVSGVSRIDYILSYMYERSKKEAYTLKVDIDCELKDLTEKIITEEDLGTLVADLIENAIIANKYNDGKYILVSFGMVKKEFIIDIYDSGIPFDKEVLAKYGREQITTHADDSGSGIGMMQTYEILFKCGASLFIDEFSRDEGLYTKRISVVFNKKHQYVLYTRRSDEEIAYLKKRSDLMLVKKW